jgi:hypothetical protein
MVIIRKGISMIHARTAIAGAVVCSIAVFCGCDSALPSPTADGNDPYAAVRQECVDTINSLRASIGLPALAYASDRNPCTDNQARLDSQNGTAHGAFGNCGEQAQNECPGYGRVESIVTGCLRSMWNEGPGEPYSQHGHYINMTNTAYSKVSVGFYTTSAGRVWAVLNFYP